MLFSMEHLTETGYPESLLSLEQIKEVVESTEDSISQQYMTKHSEIMRKIELLKVLFYDGKNCWNQTAELEDSRQCFDNFIHNIEHNYSSHSSAHVLVNSVENRTQRLSAIAAAIHAYPSDRKAWEVMLAQHGHL